MVNQQVQYKDTMIVVPVAIKLQAPTIQSSQLILEYLLPKKLEVEVIQLVPQERIQERIAEQVVDIPLPQIMEEMMDVVLFIPRTRQNRTVEQIVHVSILLIEEETSEWASCGMHCTWHRFCVLRPPVPMCPPAQSLPIVADFSFF